MYDWEVINYLKDKNYKLTSDEYIYLCSTCPQITHIKAQSRKISIKKRAGRCMKNGGNAKYMCKKRKE